MSTWTMVQKIRQQEREGNDLCQLRFISERREIDREENQRMNLERKRAIGEERH